MRNCLKRNDFCGSLIFQIINVIMSSSKRVSLGNLDYCKLRTAAVSSNNFIVLSIKFELVSVVSFILQGSNSDVQLLAD